MAFGNGNAKLPDGIYHFSLLSGHTCPGALECLAKVNLTTGKLIDGDGRFRCYSAMMEAAFPALRRLREHNTNLLRYKYPTFEGMVDLIQRSLPIHARYIRIHVGGDFFNQIYFDAWLETAKRNPSIVFYAYTKSLRYWVARLNEIPDNFRLTASRGGYWDNLIEEYNLRSAEVVFSESEANIRGLEIDHDDSHAYGDTMESFALLLHGAQKAGSTAAKALQALRKQGLGGYSKKKAKTHAV